MAAMLAAYLLATTLPFKWYTNDAVIDPSGVTFYKGGLLQTRASLYWMSEVIEENAFTINLTVQPFVADQTGPARILTISEDHYNSNLTVGHDGVDLIVRLRRNADALLGTPAYVVEKVFQNKRVYDIRVVVREQQFSIWVDDQLRLEALLPPQPLSYWNPESSLALGNELTWERPWLGKISVASIAIKSKTIDLLLPNVVKRSGFQELARRRVAVLPGSLTDALLNLFALIPLGALTMSCLARPNLSTLMIFWAPICLLAECMQIVTMTRYPSGSDFVLNMAGLIIGSIAYSASPRLQRFLGS